MNPPASNRNDLVLVLGVSVVNQKFILSAYCILLAACTLPRPVPSPAAAPTHPPQPALTPFPISAGYGARGSWYELYFTDPSAPLASQLSGGPDGPLAAAIDRARLTVDVAIYHLGMDSIRNALLRAYDRGVRVRVVMESAYLDETDAQSLTKAGIAVRGDSPEGLMHNKFVVIDGSDVWTGSMNFTAAGAYADNNNLLRIVSPDIAEDYSWEFEEMYVHERFGEDVVADTPHPRVTLDASPVDVYFSPDDGVEAALLELIANAEESVYFMAFSFTSDSLGQALRERARSGVTVQGVMDADQVASNLGTEYDAFRQAGLPVRIDGIFGQMHHKVMIIDAQIVVTGSYNFTSSAEQRNDENLLVIYDAAIAAQFLSEFQRVYEQARP